MNSYVKGHKTTYTILFYLLLIYVWHGNWIMVQQWTISGKIIIFFPSDTHTHTPPFTFLDINPGNIRRLKQDLNAISELMTFKQILMPDNRKQTTKGWYDQIFRVFFIDDRIF